MTNTAAPKTNERLSAADKEYFAARRDYFIDNLYIAEWLLESLDEDDDYNIHVIDVFERRFITLTYKYSDIEMVYVQRDGSVFACASNGMCGDIQSPMLYGMHDIDRQGEWYAGDEVEKIGEIDIDNETHAWYNMVNSVKPQTFGVSKATMKLIIDRYAPAQATEEE